LNFMQSVYLALCTVTSHIFNCTVAVYSKLEAIFLRRRGILLTAYWLLLTAYFVCPAVGLLIVVFFATRRIQFRTKEVWQQ
jgi:hypothetical protein